MQLLLWVALLVAGLAPKSWVPGLIAAAIAAAFAVAVTVRNLDGLGLEPRPAYLAARLLAPFVALAVLRGLRWAFLRLRAAKSAREPG